VFMVACRCVFVFLLDGTKSGQFYNLAVDCFKCPENTRHKGLHFSGNTFGVNLHITKYLFFLSCLGIKNKQYRIILFFKLY
jgi:hypothetical protein